MKRLGALAVVVLGACAGGTTSSDLFCEDLRDGMSLMNLWDGEQAPDDYAEAAYGRMKSSCPELIPRYGDYFESWGYPDS